MDHPLPMHRLHWAILLAVWLFCLQRLDAADPPSTTQPVATEGHVGYRKLSIEYHGSDQEERERTTLIWYPTSVESQRYDYHGQIGFVAPDAAAVQAQHPLILFSHGFFGKADQTIFLMEAWARQGYIVAALDHADAMTQKKRKPVWPNFANPKSWSDQKFLDRREDVAALLNYLLQEDEREDSFLHRRIDRKAIGAAGHSLGGYTVLGMVGGWESWRDERIQAALLLSPYASPYIEHDRLSDVKTPIMLQGGTLDFGITPFLPKVYDRLDAPKYYLVLKNETHFGWTNLVSLGKTTTECAKSGNPALVTEYSTAFFDRHLKRAEKADTLDEKNHRLETYQHAAE